ncbi:MAG: FAD-binding oxidoreductase [Rhodospirillales bacterium]|nr:FAD-binding oxidoreductase [Rhodospirillales bacterium]
MLTPETPVRFSDALPEAVDVVVIGAGITGTATAWFLAKHGKSVLLAEKGRVAAEQSSRNWGWVRQHGRDWAELPIMMEANRIWRGLAEETGECDLAFTRSACVKLAEDPSAIAGMEAWRELAVEHQLDTVMLSKADIAERFPDLKGDFVGGSMTASDGRAEPWLAIPALARAAQRAGVAVIEDCAVRTLERTGGRVSGVVTEKGTVRCDQVVLAGGAWSTYFCANEGVDLPQLAVRSTAARTNPAPEVLPLNVSVPGLAIRRRADGCYSVSTGDVAEHYIAPKSFRYATKFAKLLKKSARDIKLKIAAPAGYPGSWGAKRRWSATEESPFEKKRVLHPDPSPLVVRRLNERIPQRLPALAGVGLAEAWAGMIDVTPDAVPTLGELDVSGLFVATGFSGHGFGIGPAAGRIMADLVTGRPAGHDLTRFRPARFFDGTPIEPGPY